MKTARRPIKPLLLFAAFTCAIAVHAFWVGTPVNAAPSETEEVLVARCNQSIAEACLDMGIKNTDAIGKSVDLARGLFFFEKGCDLGSARACTLAALGHYTARGSSTRDLMKAINYGTKACDGNDAAGCYNLGTVYKNATGLPNYAEEAATLYARSCTLGSLIACGISNRVTTLPASTSSVPADGAAAQTRSPTARNCLNETDYEACWLATRGSSEGNYARSSQPSSVPASNGTITARKPGSVRFEQSCNLISTEGCQTSRRTLAGHASSADGPPEGQADGQTEGRVVCTSSSSIARKFSYTNSFAGTANRLSQYQQSYVSMENSLQSRLMGMGVGSFASNETTVMNCTWHASQTKADEFIDRAIVQARRDQMMISRTYFSTN